MVRLKEMHLALNPTETELLAKPENKLKKKKKKKKADQLKLRITLHEAKISFPLVLDSACVLHTHCESQA